MNLFDSILSANDASNWLTAAGVFLISLAVLELIRFGLLGILASLVARKYADYADLLRAIQRTSKQAFIFGFSLYLGSLQLTLPLGWHEFFRLLLLITLFLQLGFWSGATIRFATALYTKRQKEKDPSQVTNLYLINLIGQIVAWTIVLMLILDNLPGVDLTAILASLGIAGIIIGLALQNIVADLFASLSITLDKPFVIGDALVIDQFSGSVEHIGLKSTRLRSVDGELVIFSNSNILDSRVRNFQRLERRRVLIQLRLSYQTPSAKLEKLPEMVSQIVQAHPYVTYGKCYFKSYTESAILYEAFYHLETPDGDIFLDTNHAIQLEIFKQIEQEGIHFTVPYPFTFIPQDGEQHHLPLPQ